MVAFTLYLLVACWGFIGDSTTVVIESEDQTTFNAVLLSLDAQGLHLQQDSNARTLQLDEVASIQFSDPLPETASPATRWVELLDGTVIAANAVTCDGEELAVELPGIEKAEGELTIGPTVRFPTKLVRTLRFQELSAAQLPPWQQLTDVQRSLDGLILLRPEEKLDAIEGLVSEITSAARRSWYLSISWLASNFLATSKLNNGK